MKRFLVVLMMLLAVAAPARAESWPDRDVQKFVFISVLDGLFELGLPDEVVDKILTVDDKGRPLSFIWECPICHPVYDAFKTYRSRSQFLGRPAGERDFAVKATPEQLAELSQDDPLARTSAVGRLVRTLIQDGIARARWNEAERADWTARIQKAEKEGQRQLRQRQAEGVKVYEAMWSCKMCDAASEACKAPK